MVSSTSSTASSGTLFAIGDLQGCLESLEELLAQLPQDAELLFVGSVVSALAIPTRCFCPPDSWLI